MAKKKKNKKNSNINNNSDTGCISILTPTYNRRAFLPLITYNIKHQTYDHSKLEWFIYDDGPEPFFTDETLKSTRESLSPIKIKYYYNKNKKSIGFKRNYLIKNATHKIVAMMDDDDIYFSSYLTKYYQIMKEKNVGLVGSAEMLFVYPKLNYLITFIKCIAERQIHEATMMITKKYYNSMPGFDDGSRGEGAKMIDFNENNVFMATVSDCMICISHKDNTISKDRFVENKTSLKLKNIECINILESIIGDQVNLNPSPEDFIYVDPDKKSSPQESFDINSSENESINQIDDILKDI
jgi:hypothetical protein